MDSVPDGINGSSIVIVGGGNAAATLREEGFAGRVVIVSREPGVPSGQPPLSKPYLRRGSADTCSPRATGVLLTWENGPCAAHEPCL